MKEEGSTERRMAGEGKRRGEEREGNERSSQQHKVDSKQTSGLSLCNSDDAAVMAPQQDRVDQERQLNQ